MASYKPNAVLAVLPLNYHALTIRARIDNLIRYVKVPKDVLDHETDIFNGPEPKVLTLDYPSGVKCLEIYRGFVLSVRPLQFELKGIEGLSLPVSHDYETFEIVDRLLLGIRDRVCAVKHPDLAEHGKMIMKIAELPENWITPDSAAFTRHSHPETDLAREFRMQRDIAALGLGIAPEIIGLVTEKGRGVIGFLMEYVEGARTFGSRTFDERKREGEEGEGYQVTENDKLGCREALRRLHEHGFLHGDLHPSNVLWCPDGRIPMMIDYEATQRVNSEGHVQGFPNNSQENERLTMDSWLRTA